MKFLKQLHAANAIIHAYLAQLAMAITSVIRVETMIIEKKCQVNLDITNVSAYNIIKSL